MKKGNMMLWTLLFLLPVLGEVAYAQDADLAAGFVVTAQGDTLYGTLKPAGQYRRHLAVQFRQSGGDAFVAYTPEDLEGYVLDDGTRYRSRQIVQSSGTTLRFLQLLVDGYTDLYRLPEASGEKLFYLEKEGGELAPIRKSSAVRILSSSFSDCAAFDALSDREKRKTYQFTVRRMMDNVVAYNQCVRPDVENIAYLTFITLPIRPGLRLGVNMTSIALPDGRKFSTDLGFLIGVFFNIGSRSRNSPFSVQPEVLLQRKRSSSEERACLTASSCVEGIEVNVTSLQVPILLKLHILRSATIDVSALAGPYGEVVVANQSESYQTTPFQEIRAAYEYADWSFGAALGVGIQYQDRYSLEVRVTEGRGGGGGLDAESKERVFQCTVGFML